MFSIDNNNKNDVSEAPNEAGTASSSILRNPPPSHQKPLPQWAQNDAQTQRKDRFKALSAIRQILLSEGSKQFPLMPTKYHRSTLCKHSLTGSEVAVLLSNEHGKAFLMACRPAEMCGLAQCVQPRFKSVGDWKLLKEWSFLSDWQPPGCYGHIHFPTSKAYAFG